jgi:hypothetical protein
VVDGRGVFDLAGAAGGGDVDGYVFKEIGGERVFADDGMGFGEGFETFGIGGGEFEPEEEGVRSFAVDEVAGESVDDLGEGELDGDAVLEGREGDDESAVHKVLLAGHGSAIEAVAFVEALMEVAEVLGAEGDGVALDSVGLDVAAEFDLHVFLLLAPTGDAVK